MSNALEVKISDGAAWINFNRPENSNSINMDMARALRDTAIDLDFNKDVRCVVLTGKGRFFCAGGDLEEFGTAQSPDKYLAELAGTLHIAVSHFTRMGKPFIAAVNGAAAGAGFSMALSADLIIAAESAHFTAAYTAIGLSPDGSMTYTLPRLVGLANSRKLILTNERCSARDAKAMGMIAEVVADIEFDKHVAALVQRMVDAPTRALGNTRALLNSTFSSTLETQKTYEMRSISELGVAAEFKEGLSAFNEKRKPNFRGI